MASMEVDSETSPPTARSSKKLGRFAHSSRAVMRARDQAMTDLEPFMREMQITDLDAAVDAWNLQQASLAAGGASSSSECSDLSGINGSESPHHLAAKLVVKDPFDKDVAPVDEDEPMQDTTPVDKDEPMLDATPADEAAATRAGVDLAVPTDMYNLAQEATRAWQAQTEANRLARSGYDPKDPIVGYPPMDDDFYVRMDQALAVYSYDAVRRNSTPKDYRHRLESLIAALCRKAISTWSTMSIEAY